ncbi:Membrane-associated 30 kDa protein, chloroplastic [Dendrobium catenatum]|uniref:Membrane-associated 30 kDa protein, chloroplastic n=1 Tax=Dendrobium catenatum TaxID=906689 RepID=A0A2I0VSV0_9ASPA|nr:Membrane-associated 30 kDa protein, chloroplastic [Dendrobium catenatum]
MLPPWFLDCFFLVTFQDNANSLKAQLEQQKSVVDNLVSNTRLLESKIQEARSKKDTLKARAQSANLLSLVALKEIHLSLLFRICGLSTRTLTIDVGGGNTATSLHIWIPRCRRPQKHTFLLIHRFGGNSKWQFHRQIGPLSRSFDLYIPDLVYFGRSLSSSGERSVGFQSQCVSAAMRGLGVEKYSVAGISYGGFVAMNFKHMQKLTSIKN